MRTAIQMLFGCLIFLALCWIAEAGSAAIVGFWR